MAATTCFSTTLRIDSGSSNVLTLNASIDHIVDIERIHLAISDGGHGITLTAAGATIYGAPASSYCRSG